MRPIQYLVPSLVADVVRRQPASPARTSFAWQMVVGPAVARVTVVELVEGTLVVTSKDPRWVAEIARAQDSVLKRLQQLLGSDQVKRIRTS